MEKQKGLRIYTVVEVWRGIAAGAKSFVDLNLAERYMRRVQARRSPQEDDVQLFETTLKLATPPGRLGRRERDVARA